MTGDQGEPGRVFGLLNDAGIGVDEATVREEFDSLEGLSDDARTDALLSSYGLDADGKPVSELNFGKGSIGATWSILRGDPASIVFIGVAALAGIVPGIAVPLLVRLFVDRYIVAEDSSWVLPVLAGLLAAVVIAGVVRGLQFAVLNRRAVTMVGAGQASFIWRILRLPVTRLAALGGGDLVARLRAMQRLAYMGGLLIPLAAVNALNAIVFAAAIVVLSPVLGLISIAVAAATVVVVIVSLKRRGAVQETADVERLALSDGSAALVTGIETIKAPAWEQFAFRGWSSRRSASAGAVSRLGLADQRMEMVPQIMQALGLGLVLAAGALLVIDGRLDLGTLVAAQSFLVSMLVAVNQLAYFGLLAQSVSSASIQVREVLELPTDPECMPGPSAGPDDHPAMALSLDRVTFGYRRGDPPLIEDLSVEISAGSRVAVVGGSGSGKSTIARLAVGELRPWSGTVGIGGTPRLALPRAVRSNAVAYVPQDCVLFPGTIFDNLTLWEDGFTDEEVLRALRDARVEDAVLSRPGGLYAKVGNATGGFSGGELQRIAIARALVGDPSVLILDEATSALDPIVEFELEERLRERGCTCLLVAHRLSTVRDADEILVVEHGRVVQRGSFDELRSEGRFAELVGV